MASNSYDSGGKKYNNKSNRMHKKKLEKGRNNGCYSANLMIRTT